MIKRIVWTYYLLNTLYMVSLSLFSAIFYVFLMKRGFSFVEINLFNIIFWGSSFITEIPAGVFADRYGRKKALQASTIIRSIGLILLAWIPSTEVLILSAALTAIGESFKSGTLESWVIDKINEINSNYNTTKLFSVDKILLTSTGIIATFFGSQIIGNVNLSYTFIMSVVMLLVVGFTSQFVMTEDCKRIKDKNNLKSIKEKFKELNNEVHSGFKYIFANKFRLGLCLSLLPLQFVLCGPSSQWQMFFQQGEERIITGYISIGISLAAMLGHYLTPKITSKLKGAKFLILTNMINGMSVIIVALCGLYWLSLSLFFIHVISMASEQVYRISYLNDNIDSENRATILSVFYSLESLVTVVGFLVIGYISDKFSIQIAWIISAAIMMSLAIPLLLSLDKKTVLKSLNNNEGKVNYD